MPTRQDKRRMQLMLWNRCKGICEYCGVKMKKWKAGETAQPKNGATIDHIIPKSKGGTYHLDNLSMVCWQCNNEKGNKLLGEAE